MLPGGGGVEDTWCLLAAADRKTGRGWVQKHILHVGHPLENAAPTTHTHWCMWHLPQVPVGRLVLAVGLALLWRGTGEML